MGMRKKFSDCLWGVFFLAIGIIIMLSAFDVLDFSLPYLISRWWPVLIIIPGFIGMIRHGFGFSVILFVVGVLLLLNNLDIITGSTFRKLIIPVILICIGFGFIFRDIINNHKIDKNITFDPSSPEFDSEFSTKTFDLSGQYFSGGKSDAVFGTVILDLRNAIIDKDVVIKAHATFGHVSILAPQYANVEITSSSVFGSVANKNKKAKIEAPTIYIDGTSVFGGVTVE